MENFTPISALIGGALIGLSATYYLFVHGRISGISGILGAALAPNTPSPERRDRLYFLFGLLLAGGLLLPFFKDHFEFIPQKSLLRLVAAGLLVGFGTRLAGGCTSGHGVCGISRFSTRSIVATLTFICTGALAVYLVRVFGGLL